MAGFATKFESTRQDWTTPPALFEELNAEFAFTLDAAADQDNAKADRYLSKDDDALRCEWGSNVVWLNPPYGNRAGKLSEWVAKSFEASRSGATVVMLIPARTNTNWFHEICFRFGEVRFIKGRPKFGDAKHGLPQPLCVVIFRPQSSGGDRGPR